MFYFSEALNYTLCWCGMCLAMTIKRQHFLLFRYVIAGILPLYQEAYECDSLTSFLSEKLTGKFPCSTSCCALQLQ